MNTAASRASDGLADQAAQSIRERITAGAIRPGQRLSEERLSSQLGISRNTLREAYRLLTQEGLLVREPNRGVFVTAPSAESVMDIYRVRRIIECQALTMADANHFARNRMYTAVVEAIDCRLAGDWNGVGTANANFHAAIVSLANSARLDRLYSLVSAELRLAFGLVHDAESLHSPYVELNEQILSLYVQGDKISAAKLLEEYLLQSERDLLAALSDYSDVAVVRSVVGRSESKR